MKIKASDLLLALTKDKKISKLPSVRHGRRLSIITKVGMDHDGALDVTVHTSGAMKNGDNTTDIVHELEAAYAVTANTYADEEITFRPTDTLVSIVIKVIYFKSGRSSSLMRFSISNRSGYEHAFTSMI